MTATPHRSRPVTRGIFFSHSIGYTHIRGLPASAAASTLAPQPFPRILYVYGAAHWLQAVHAAERLTNKDKKKTRKKVHARAAPPPPPPSACRQLGWGARGAPRSAAPLPRVTRDAHRSPPLSLHPRLPPAATAQQAATVTRAPRVRPLTPHPPTPQRRPSSQPRPGVESGGCPAAAAGPHTPSLWGGLDPAPFPRHPS